MNAAIENLKTNQRQLDADGCEVGVSRQALDETLALLDELLKATVEALNSNERWGLTMRRKVAYEAVCAAISKATD